MNTFLIDRKCFFSLLIVCCFVIAMGGIVHPQREIFDGSTPAYMGALEQTQKAKEQTTLETSFLYLLEGLETWGAWLDPNNEVGLLPEAEGRFMIPNAPLLQTGGTIPSGIAITGFAQPITINRDGIPQGFAENEYLYEQPLIKYDDSVEDIFQKVPYLDRLNYQYGIGMDGRTVKVYRKSIEAEFTLLATLQKMGTPPEVAEAWVEEYAKVASLPQTIQLAWLITGNPLAEAYQPHVNSVLEPLNLSTLQINGAPNTGGWVSQDPFWIEAQKQPFMKAFTDLLSNANEEIKRSFIVALFFLEPTSQITGITGGSDDLALRPKPYFLSSKEGVNPKVISGPTFSEGENTDSTSYLYSYSYKNQSSSGEKLVNEPSIKIIPKEQQVESALLGGTVYENRPISFPAYGKTSSYSSLFYWSNIEARKDQEFDLNLHKGFEIMTFVFEGKLEHYNTNTEKWTLLSAGGVQVMKAGDGIEHAERYTKGLKAFQIWLDPDFKRSLEQKSTSQDYQADSFTETSINGIKTRSYVGYGGPIQLETEDLRIRKLTFSDGEHKLELNPNTVYSMYVMDGNINFDGQQASKDAHIIIKDMESVTLNVLQESQLFIVETPEELGYTTYAQGNKGR